GRPTTMDTLHPAPPLGLGELAHPRYNVDSFPLQPGDLLLLYTDGVTEARDSTGTCDALSLRERPQQPLHVAQFTLDGVEPLCDGPVPGRPDRIGQGVDVRKGRALSTGPTRRLRPLTGRRERRATRNPPTGHVGLADDQPGCSRQRSSGATEM
ncbi:SpoIIE family protein phosphatase, partial [Streptomyces sp. NPDC056721]|uniref:SpoIIE family protein phosphatase n=1 Tax=Streptomyces sp. NPDC056721 TaxID=3345923 RepID=UPI003691E046